VKDPAGRKLGSIVWLHDSTGTTGMEASDGGERTAHATQDKLVEIFDALPVPVWRRNEALDIVWWNAAFSAAVGGGVEAVEQPSSGLGLPLVERFVELHGGRVELVSTRRKGTRVTCTFPERTLTRQRLAAADGQAGRKPARTHCGQRTRTVQIVMPPPEAKVITPSRSFALEIGALSETEALATATAEIAAPGDVIALAGALGTGKTTFARFFIRALGGTEEVPSPTFSLVQVYDLARAPVWHFDLYRLRDPEDGIELGIDEALSSGISLIEWPDRLGGMLPEDRLELTFDDPAGGPRRANLAGRGSWSERAQVLAARLAAP